MTTIALISVTRQSARRFVSDEAVWAAAVAADPPNPFANLWLADYAARSGRYDEADRHLAYAAADPAYLGRVWAIRGAIHEGRGPDDPAELSAALACYRRSIAAEPTEPRAHFQAGTLLLRRGDLAAAERQLRIAVGYTPVLPEAYDNLGVCLLHEGRRDDARAAFAEAQRLKPDLPFVAKHLADVGR